ncbi:MAG TPA: restriction endonuclease subunit R, partial [Pseudoxanthomonas sp.]|nr:restriction endonuclease subunit R [Pseudoxanthomonas sp.]
AELYRWVTPVTAELLRWWFGNETARSRSFNFHPGQRQAILNLIVAHEVLASQDLADLYRQVCPWALQGARLAEAAQHTHAHPRYCLKMATGTGKTWVLQALLVWQMLNRTAALDEARDDPRFTHCFLIVAPGPMACERLLDALLGKEREDSSRDFSTSDLAAYADLFVPPARRGRVERFVRGNVCMTQDIGLKASANGMIAVAHRHLLGNAGEEDIGIDPLATYTRPSVVPRQVVPSIARRAAGSGLDVPNHRRVCNELLAFLAELPDLMVFNVEGHRSHASKKEGEAGEAEWRKRLSTIAVGKGRRFVQMDFSAAPYGDVDGGKRKAYSPHIVVDFDLKDALRQGLVKSPVLDRSEEIAALPPEFEAERDEHGNVRLSQVQRAMLRAGLHKLRRLEADFARVDPHRRPRMLVVCGDAQVPSLVADFLIDQGLHEDKVVMVDSSGNAEPAENQRTPLRPKRVDLDRHAQPRVIVSGPMLCEGFDAGTVCVIVPLRSGRARIPLEQILGHGLCPMWRDPEYAELKRENRALIGRGKAPGSLFDVLSIIEHPVFQCLYDELLREGLAGTSGDDDGTGSTGDLIDSELREDHAQYDFAIPFVVHEADETLEDSQIETVGPALVEAQARHAAGDTEVRHRRLSEVAALKVRASTSLCVDKCIYTRLPYPARSGGLERAFIEWARTDSSTQAFCGIGQNRHKFMRLPYVTEDGLPAFHFPDFLVRTVDRIYLAETKAQGQLGNPNVPRKLEAAAAWCERINGLPAELRGQRRWHYALIGEASFWQWRQNGARLGELLAFSRVAPAPHADAQGRLPLQD